jgi:hypothetical protein
MRYRLIALAALAVAAVAMPAAAAPRYESIGVEVQKRKPKKIPVVLSCPVDRVRCGGTIAFSGRKKRGGTTYKLSADPFRFSKFREATTKTIDFSLSPAARRTLRNAGGMTVTFVVQGRYAEGPDDTVRVSAKLPAEAR